MSHTPSPGARRTVPGYAKGKAPYGRYAVKTTTPRSWAEETVNDVAAMVLATPATGKRLTRGIPGCACAQREGEGRRTC
ncbi:hypothetical protein GCM10010313_24040 [Streptomyces violarus]|uniref:Uncharacterized protein n=1 Tax=Streptomyces violarus TaxID=67380 RepID=A0A7W5F3I7_9ACTN|nr:MULTISPECIES: hypothetical protein [Streptomyces]MBB3078661.1 hypothetical protein [Streptomyces violarus]WRU03193.1 hypothetical protein VJ737_38335 [Streptomyces sp. CGMCC 4.1772]GHD06205.1 hypothetical protein GCM10010313_24040 [Streptomyces violarus]